MIGNSLLPGEGSPVVANGVVYLAGHDGVFYAYDADGQTNCDGTPKTCVPLWTGNLASVPLSTPAVVGGFAYVTAGGRLHVFDANGTTNCTTTLPKTCNPVWTALSGNGSTTIAGNGTPIVARGRVYVAGSPMRVFDSRGQIGCGGTPKVCEPLWQTDRQHPGIPAIAGDFVYIDEGTQERVLAYDVRGVGNCGGTPKTCAPIWAGNIYCSSGGGIICRYTSPVVWEGKVFINAVTAFGDRNEGGLSVFDAAGAVNCTAGTPRSCNPIRIHIHRGGDGTPAIANGLIYVSEIDSSQLTPGLFILAYPIDGATGCTGTPPNCGPVWRSRRLDGTGGSYSVANDVLYATTSPGGAIAEFAAFDERGCPTVPCPSLRSFSITGLGDSPVAIADGFAYVHYGNRLSALTAPITG